jgi:hypothetical protein
MWDAEAGALARRGMTHPLWRHTLHDQQTDCRQHPDQEDDNLRQSHVVSTAVDLRHEKEPPPSHSLGAAAEAVSQSPRLVPCACDGAAQSSTPRDAERDPTVTRA